MRLIDADELIKIITENVYTIIHEWNSIEPGMSLNGIMQAIDEQTIIDAIQVVRCKDCTYWQDQKEGVVEVPICKYDCRWDKKGVVIVMGADDYCSHGERKEDGVDR